jgi:hypothetical protein
MGIYNSPELVESWRRVAALCSKSRPSVGKIVRVIGGRKHKGRGGQVVRHVKSKFAGYAERYKSEAQLTMREMQGTFGYCVQIDPGDGSDLFWVNAEYVEIYDDPGICNITTPKTEEKP